MKLMKGTISDYFKPESDSHKIPGQSLIFYFFFWLKTYTHRAHVRYELAQMLIQDRNVISSKYIRKYIT